MLKSCPYCGRIHDTKIDCGRRPKRDRSKYVYDTDADNFHHSTAWTKKSLQIRQRDHFLCQLCLRRIQMITQDAPTLNYDGVSVHHIVPIAEDYERRLDDDNLITVCSWHHELCEEGKISREELSQIVREQEEKFEKDTPGGQNR